MGSDCPSKARRGLCVANGFSSIVADENDSSDDADIRYAPISLLIEECA